MPRCSECEGWHTISDDTCWRCGRDLTDETERQQRQVFGPRQRTAAARPGDTADGQLVASQPETYQRADQGERGASAYVDAIVIAVAGWVVVSFVLGVLIAVLAQDLLDEDYLIVFGLLGLAALVVGIVVGVRFAKLNGWRSWIIVVVGSTAGVFALTLVMGMFGDIAMLAFLGVALWWLVWGRKRLGLGVRPSYEPSDTWRSTPSRHMLAGMGVLEHLRSPQYMTEDGRPTNKSEFNRMMRVTAPGTPRWVGYLMVLAIFGVGLVALFAYNVEFGLIVIGSAIYGSLEVWRGKPFLSRRRIDYPPPEDEGQPSKPG